ncbi:retrovirus-related pol polyprotein from transposon TNT 1-94 [Tanacetum coccineum]
MFSELLNGTSPVVSKSSAVHAADNPDKRQQHNTTHTSTTTDVADPPPLNIQSTHQTPTQVPTITASENIIQAETNTENAQFDDDEFINIFSTPVQEQGETLSRHVDSSNMHVWELVDRPLCKNVINLKWLWKNKRDEENTIFRNNLVLIAKIAQKVGIDFEESFAPVALLEAVRLFISMLHTNHFHVPQMDVLKQHFFSTTKGRCVRKPTDGFVDHIIHDKFICIKEALYGLIQDTKSVDCTSMSSADAGVCVFYLRVATVLWLRTQLTDYGFHFDKIPILEYQLADLFTKALSEDRFKYLVRRLGMRCLTPDELEVLAIESA